MESKRSEGTPKCPFRNQTSLRLQTLLDRMGLLYRPRTIDNNLIKPLICSEQQPDLSLQDTTVLQSLRGIRLYQKVFEHLMTVTFRESNDPTKPSSTMSSTSSASFSCFSAAYNYCLFFFCKVQKTWGTRKGHRNVGVKANKALLCLNIKASLVLFCLPCPPLLLRPFLVLLLFVTIVFLLL